MIQKLLVNHFNKYLNPNIYEISLKINLYSPFFNFLSNKDFFDKIFTISIPTSEIEKYKSNKNHITEKFNILNRTQSKYSSIEFYYNNTEDIIFLKEFQINFNHIKRLEIKQNKYNILFYYDYDYFFQTFFSLDNNIINNLVYLNIENKLRKIYIKLDLFEDINNFKSLEYLKLSFFDFKTDLTLKLFTLKEISLNYCDKIIFEENSLLKLKNLTFNNCILNNREKPLIKLPLLERCSLIVFYGLDSSRQYNELIDFNSLKKLKYFEGEQHYFLLLKNKSLEKVKLISAYESININGILQSVNEIEKRVIEKINSIETLKEIKIQLNKISNSDIAKIEGDNTSVENLKISFYGNTLGDHILYFLQKKYPYLSSIKIWVKNNSNYNDNAELKIIENHDCIIKKIKLIYDEEYNLNLYFPSYEKIEEINLIIENKYVNLNSFPIFSDKCKILFKSLTKFHLSLNNTKRKDILNNIYKNIDNMPNLKDFKIVCNTFCDKEEYYNLFIKKILSLKLIKRINIYIRDNDINEYYTKDELKRIYHEFNFLNFYEMIIQKLKTPLLILNQDSVSFCSLY